MTAEMASDTLGHLSVYLDQKWPEDTRSLSMFEVIGFHADKARTAMAVHRDRIKYMLEKRFGNLMESASNGHSVW